MYAEWSARGAEFLTPPKQHEFEIRCYIRDPDGYLIEVGQTTDPEGGLVDVAVVSCGVMTTAMPAARTERWARMHIEMFHSSGTGRPSRRDGQPIRSQPPARAGLLIGSPT